MSTDEALSQRQKLAASLAPIGQQHLLAFWDQLNAEERDRLRSQIEGIDPELFRELRAEFAQGEATGGDAKSKWAALAARVEPPPAMRLDGGGVRFAPEQARYGGSGAAASGPSRNDPRGRRIGDTIGLRSAEGSARAWAAIGSHAVSDFAGEVAGCHDGTMASADSAVCNDEPGDRRGDAAVS